MRPTNNESFGRRVDRSCRCCLVDKTKHNVEPFQLCIEKRVQETKYSRTLTFVDERAFLFDIHPLCGNLRTERKSNRFWIDFRFHEKAYIHLVSSNLRDKEVVVSTMIDFQPVQDRFYNCVETFRFDKLRGKNENWRQEKLSRRMETSNQRCVDLNVLDHQHLSTMNFFSALKRNFALFETKSRFLFTAGDIIESNFFS